MGCGCSSSDSNVNNGDPYHNTDLNADTPDNRDRWRAEAVCNLEKRRQQAHALRNDVKDEYGFPKLYMQPSSVEVFDQLVNYTEEEDSRILGIEDAYQKMIEDKEIDSNGNVYSTNNRNIEGSYIIGTTQQFSEQVGRTWQEGRGYDYWLGTKLSWKQGKHKRMILPGPTKEELAENDRRREEIKRRKGDAREKIGLPRDL